MRFIQLNILPARVLDHNINKGLGSAGGQQGFGKILEAITVLEAKNSKILEATSQFDSNYEITVRYLSVSVSVYKPQKILKPIQYNQSKIK